MEGAAKPVVVPEEEVEEVQSRRSRSGGGSC